MSSLQLRKIPFAFDETVPFQWQPSNPAFGIFTNFVSFLAVAFERYLIAVVRDAMPLITDPAVREEADLFLRQEALHAGAHRRHINALIAQHPGLRTTLERACEHYDRLYESQPLAFHLAYIADLEATFTPAFKLNIDHRESLFRPGDARVASLFLWHYIEEIEHRSSGLILYNAVVGRRWYRLAVLPKVLIHLLAFNRLVLDEFERQVPHEARTISTRPLTLLRIALSELVVRLPLVRWLGPRRAPTAFEAVPTREMLAAAWRLVRSQTPYHDPEHQPLPAWSTEWLAAYEAGRDMTTFYGAAPDPSRRAL